MKKKVASPRKFVGKRATSPEKKFVGKKSPAAKKFVGKKTLSPARKGVAEPASSPPKKFSGKKSSPEKKFVGKKSPPEKKFVGKKSPPQKKFVGRPAPIAASFAETLKMTTGLSCGTVATLVGNGIHYTCPDNHVHIPGDRDGEAGCCVPLYDGRGAEMSYAEKLRWIDDTVAQIMAGASSNDPAASGSVAKLMREHTAAAMHLFSAKLLVDTEDLCAQARARGDCEAIGACEWTPGYVYGGKCQGKLRKKYQAAGRNLIDSIRHTTARLSALQDKTQPLTGDEQRELSYLKTIKEGFDRSEKEAFELNERTKATWKQLVEVRDLIKVCRGDRKCTLLENLKKKEEMLMDTQRGYVDSFMKKLKENSTLIYYVVAGLLAVGLSAFLYTQFPTQITGLLGPLGEKLKYILQTLQTSMSAYFIAPPAPPPGFTPAPGYFLHSGSTFLSGFTPAPDFTPATPLPSFMTDVRVKEAVGSIFNVAEPSTISSMLTNSSTAAFPAVKKVAQPSTIASVLANSPAAALPAGKKAAAAVKKVAQPSTIASVLANSSTAAFPAGAAAEKAAGNVFTVVQPSTIASLLTNSTPTTHTNSPRGRSVIR